MNHRFLEHVDNVIAQVEACAGLRLQMEVRSPEDLYPLVEDLIIRLGREGDSRLAAILDHRMHKVAWTSAFEHLEELQRVLGNELPNEGELSPPTYSLLKQVVGAIDELLRAV